MALGDRINFFCETFPSKQLLRFFSGLVITFPAETAAPTDAKSVLAIFVQNLQEQPALQQKEHRHGVWPTIFNPQL